MQDKDAGQGGRDVRDDEPLTHAGAAVDDHTQLRRPDAVELELLEVEDATQMPCEGTRLLALAPQAIWVSISAIGGFVLVFSAVLLIFVLIASLRGPAVEIAPLRFSLAVKPPRRLPASLNGFGVWVLLVVALTVANYGYPLAQFLFLSDTGVPAFPVQAP